MYEFGRGVPKNDVEAVKWFRKAAEQGYAAGQTCLGVMYENGRGVPENDAEAARWFRKAAEQGYAAGQTDLGFMYEYGRGVAKDYVEAVKWYRKAAEQGDPADQDRLGTMYLNGRGVARDENEALRWFRKAADQGWEDAYSYLSRNVTNEVEREKWRRKLAASIEAKQRNAQPQVTQSAPVKAVEEVNSLSIDLVRENGVLKVPIQINGALTLKFVVDSGASDVAIPKDVFLTLIRAETVKDADLRPGKTYILADGSTVKSDRFILRSLKIGSTSFSDIEASVGGLNAQLLLGQSFLSKFKEWRIDNATSKLILTR
jgi:clan AA aspartic protease (TIGR02281 family)